MATQAHNDDRPFVIDNLFRAAIAGAQERFGYILDVRIAKDILFKMFTSWDGSRETFHETKSNILDTCLPPGEQRSPYTSFVIRYYRLLKSRKAKPLAAKAPETTVSQSDWDEFEKTDEWTVLVCERTREIQLFHNPTLSHSESLYHESGFSLGSVIVEGMPCRNKWLPKRHHTKCAEVTYRILSGR